MDDLLERLSKARRGSRTRQVLTGLLLPLRATRFLWAHRRLIPFVVVPALINVVLFGTSVYIFVHHAADLVGWLWEEPIVDGLVGYLLAALWYVVYVVSVAAAIVVSYVVVLAVGGIVASPFHDVLSERTERILRGDDDLADPDASMIGSLLRSIGSSAFIALLYAAFMAPVLLLNLIPGVGTVAATVLGACVSAFFVALEYTDPTLQRHEVRLKDKIGLIWKHLPLTGSFGLGASLLLWVPLMNFLCMPIAIIGGTALALAVDET